MAGTAFALLLANDSEWEEQVMRSIISAAFAVVLLISGAASAQDKAKVLQEREDLMKQQGRELIVIRNYAEGKADQAAALAAVAALAKSVPTVPNYFPAGSEGPNPDGKYGPKPEVFSQRDKLVAAAKEVADQIAALETAIKSGDATKVAADYKEIGFCKSCHDTFRAKLQ